MESVLRNNHRIRLPGNINILEIDMEFNIGNLLSWCQSHKFKLEGIHLDTINTRNLGMETQWRAQEIPQVPNPLQRWDFGEFDGVKDD